MAVSIAPFCVVNRLDTCYLLFMANAHSKAVAAEAVPADQGRSGDPFSQEIKARRRKLIAAINSSHAGDAEQAEAALTKYLDDIYPETTLSDQ